MKTLELHYAMIRFLVNILHCGEKIRILCSSGKNDISRVSAANEKFRKSDELFRNFPKMCEDIISEDFRGRYEDVSLIRLNTERLTVLLGLTDLHFPTFVRHGLTSSGNTPTIEFRTFARKCSNFDCFFFSENYFTIEK